MQMQYLYFIKFLLKICSGISTLGTEVHQVHYIQKHVKEHISLLKRRLFMEASVIQVETELESRSKVIKLYNDHNYLCCHKLECT